MENPKVHSIMVMGIIETTLAKELEDHIQETHLDPSEFHSGYAAGLQLALDKTREEIASIVRMLDDEGAKQLSEVRKFFGK